MEKDEWEIGTIAFFVVGRGQGTNSGHE